MEVISTHSPARTQKSSSKTTEFFLDIYNIYRFLLRFFKELLKPPYEGKELMRQCYEIGCKSIPIISLTAFITGIVFTKQSRPSLSSFGAASWLPSLIGIAIIRALAPLLTALVIAGKVGSNMGAELGSMKVTEQIDAMEVSSTHPFKYLVSTRVLGITIMMPMMVSLFAFVGLMGAYLNVHHNELTSFTTFVEDAFSSISFLDLIATFTKSVVYGLTIGFTGCYNGFNAAHGTVGVGRAANASVVTSMFIVFIEEMVIVQIINYFR